MFSSLTSLIFGTPAATTNVNSGTPKRQQDKQKQQVIDNITTTTSELQYNKSLKKFTPKIYWPSSLQLEGIHPQLRRHVKVDPVADCGNLCETSGAESSVDEDEWFVIEEWQKPILYVDCEQKNDSDSESDISYSQWIKTAEDFKLKPRNPRCKVTVDFLRRIQRPQLKKDYCQRSRHQKKTVKLNLCESDDETVATRSFTQSLINADKSRVANNQVGDSKNVNHTLNGAKPGMEESWYITPPPCFTSTGPKNMTTSPYENLLIEHPSMSVYHSIRDALEPSESFVNLDIGEEESQMEEKQQAAPIPQLPEPPVRPPSPKIMHPLKTVKRARPAKIVKDLREKIGKKKSAPIEEVVEPIIIELPRKFHSNGVRVKRINTTATTFEADIKEEELLRDAQKKILKKERQKLRKSAIKRSNKVREYQGRGKPQRRADMQHCRLISGANNNRKGYC